MKNPSNNQTIFKGILIRVLIIIIVFNSMLAFINIYNTVERIRKNDIKVKETLKKEIVSLTEFQTSALNSLAKDLANSQADILHKLLKIQLEDNLRTFDLEEFSKQVNLDSKYHSLYIIENGIIVNTTFPTDRGLNFYNLGQEYRRFLQKILIQDDIFKLGFAFEYRTKKLRAYSYLPTNDKKYLIEIGSYSETANEIILMFKKRLLELANQHDDIVSMNLWIENQGDKFPLIDDSYNVFTIDTLVNHVFTYKQDVKQEFDLEDRSLSAEFIYFKLEKNSFLPEFTVSIIRDTDYNRKPVTKIITNQILATLIFTILILIFIFIVLNNSKKKMVEIE